MDNLHALEERVAGAVALISRLRADNAAMSEKLKKTESEAKRLQHEVEKAQAAASAAGKHEDEIHSLRAERDAVKTRITAIIEKLAVLDAEK